ncbi:MAG: acyl-CoA synthetase, partial [Acidiferrobacterales bacterium]
MNKFDQHLAKNAANFTPLTPLSFLARAAAVYPAKTAVVYGGTCFDYATFYVRCRCLASALAGRGIGLGDTVAVMAPNVPALLEAHYGVPMCGAVLNALNIRLDPNTIAFILKHGEAKLLIADRQFADVIGKATSQLDNPPTVIDINDPLGEAGSAIGEKEYDTFLDGGDPNYSWQLPRDEWQAISLNYTSGTTGNPKGVVYHHRGAYLNALGNILALGLCADSVYLWTLPMFHCNGWTYTWAVTAVGGTHVCLRQVDPARVFASIAANGVTHMCGAPIVLNALINAPEDAKKTFSKAVEAATGGAAPPSTVINKMEAMGFHVIHLYGLTESFGPATLCAWQDNWDTLDKAKQADMVVRQGVGYSTLEDVRVVNRETRSDVPTDGEVIGEIWVKGNTVMKGYLKNPKATDEAFADGWFHTGDLAVVHSDGYVEIKDRAKDIIISGGENISSLEVEEVLYKHPAVMEAAVVAQPDEYWGEIPCAFITLKPHASDVGETDIIGFCRNNMAHFKAPRKVVFCELPKTSTGKIQKTVLRERARTLSDSPN